MKDCSFEIHKAYFERFSESGFWPVFDRPDGRANAPYITIDNVAMRDESTKTSSMQRVTVQITAWAAYTGDAGGKKEVELEGSLIIDAVTDKNRPLDCRSGFHIITRKIESATTVEDPRNLPQNFIRRVLRFTHLVEEL
jgi:hypothetical protein